MSNSEAVSQSPNMSDLLPTDLFWTTIAGVQNEDGNFRVYFQNEDHQIYEMTLNDTKSTIYTLLKLTTSTMPAARIDTPIAAVAWKNLQQVWPFNANPSYIVIMFSFHHDRSVCITSLSIIGCRNLPILKTVVGKKARPWAPRLRTAPVCMRRTDLPLSPCSGSGSSHPLLPRLLLKLLIT